MKLPIYCNACNEAITFDPDGAGACDCTSIAAQSQRVPATWDMSRQELEEARWQLEQRAQRAAA